MESEEGINGILEIDYRPLRLQAIGEIQASTTVAEQLPEQGIFLSLRNSGYQALLTKDKVFATVRFSFIEREKFRAMYTFHSQQNS